MLLWKRVLVSWGYILKTAIARYSNVIPFDSQSTILTIKTRLMYIYLYIYTYIYIYICNELIEETAGHRKLIFGMWESFGYGSSKF